MRIGEMKRLFENRTARVIVGEFFDSEGYYQEMCRFQKENCTKGDIIQLLAGIYLDRYAADRNAGGADSKTLNYERKQLRRLSWIGFGDRFFWCRGTELEEKEVSRYEMYLAAKAEKEENYERLKPLYRKLHLSEAAKVDILKFISSDCDLCRRKMDRLVTVTSRKELYEVCEGVLLDRMNMDRYNQRVEFILFVLSSLAQTESPSLDDRETARIVEGRAIEICDNADRYRGLIGA